MERTTYRVYTARDLSSIPPSTLKSHAARGGGLGWSGFLFLVVIGLMIGGSSYAALRVVKPDAPRATAALGITTEPAKPAALDPSVGPPKVTVPTAPSIAGVASGAPAASAKPVAKPTTAPAPPRRPVIVRAKPPAPASSTTTTTTASTNPSTVSLPPNPFDDPS